MLKKTIFFFGKTKFRALFQKISLKSKLVIKNTIERYVYIRNIRTYTYIHIVSLYNLQKFFW